MRRSVRTSEEVRRSLLKSAEAGIKAELSRAGASKRSRALSFLKDASLFGFLAAYSMAGALVMLHVELPRYEADVVTENIQYNNLLLDLRRNFCDTLTNQTISQNGSISANQCVAYLMEALRRLEDIRQCPLRLTWNFKNALLYVVTVYTTIGYGSIVAKTTVGRLFTIVYACFGIPLMFTVLARLGHLFSIALHYIWAGARFLLCGYAMLMDGQLVDLAMHEYEFPLSLALLMTLGWLFLCAAIFQQWESQWNYVTAVYYTFTSLSTIGFGDVLPRDTTKILLAFLFILVGLSLVSMCITLMQTKMEKFFEKLMMMIETRYKQTQIEADSTMDADPMKALQRFLNDNKQAKWLISFLGKQHRHQLLDEWHARARMKLKSTQTERHLSETEIQCAPAAQETGVQCSLIWKNGKRGAHVIPPAKEIRFQYSDYDDFKQLLHEVNLLLTDCRGLISSKS